MGFSVVVDLLLRKCQEQPKGLKPHPFLAVLIPETRPRRIGLGAGVAVGYIARALPVQNFDRNIREPGVSGYCCFTEFHFKKEHLFYELTFSEHLAKYTDTHPPTQA